MQAAGGSLAAGESNTLGGNTKPGTNIMVAGIVFQMASMSVFVGVLVDFLIRCIRTLRGVLSWANYRVIAAMMLSMLAVYVRSIYRTVELVQGWSGYLITHQQYFIGFDAALMTFALVVYQVPGVSFQSLIKPVGGEEEDREEGEKSLLSEKIHCVFAKGTGKGCGKVEETETE